MEKIPVKNASLVRDIKSRAILSTDLEAKRAYDKKKEFHSRIKQLFETVRLLEERLNSQESLIQELLKTK